MPPYLRLGSIPRKRHTIHPQQPGFKGEGIYYEEVVGLAGFSRAYSIVYHLRPPTRVVRLEPAGTIPADFGDQLDAAPSSCENANDSSLRRPDLGPGRRSSAMTTSPWRAAAPSSLSASCFETPTPTR